MFKDLTDHDLVFAHWLVENMKLLTSARTIFSKVSAYTIDAASGPLAIATKGKRQSARNSRPRSSVIQGLANVLGLNLEKKELPLDSASITKNMLKNTCRRSRMFNRRIPSPLTIGG